MLRLPQKPRFVWVRPHRGIPECPGLLVEWRRNEHGVWFGRVVCVVVEGELLDRWYAHQVIRRATAEELAEWYASERSESVPGSG